MSLSQSTAGEAVAYAAFQTKQGLSFNLTMTRANLIFVTKQFPKLSIVDALSQVLGAISGMTCSRRRTRAL